MTENRAVLFTKLSYLLLPAKQFWTIADVPGVKFASKPVYLLTSAETFSGAEEFTCDLKNLKRAGNVGERTGGGAPPDQATTDWQSLSDRRSVCEAHEPDIQDRLGGDGGAPDVKVQAANALEAAQRLAERKLEAK